mgnify:FL=1
MENEMNAIEELLARYPQLEVCAAEIAAAADALSDCFRGDGKVLVCGNGGSAAEAEHIVGELMKKFRKPRPVAEEIAAKLPPELAARLEGALPAISLVSMSGLLTAFANDVAWEAAFAQQVLGLGGADDVLMALSTSGDSMNCMHAARVARAKGMRVIALTGARGGSLAALADVAIRVPANETFKVQELHLPVYHALCAYVEDCLF